MVYFRKHKGISNMGKYVNKVLLLWDKIYCNCSHGIILAVVGVTILNCIAPLQIDSGSSGALGDLVKSIDLMLQGKFVEAMEMNCFIIVTILLNLLILITLIIAKWKFPRNLYNIRCLGISLAWTVILLQFYNKYSIEFSKLCYALQILGNSIIVMSMVLLMLCKRNQVYQKVTQVMWISAVTRMFGLYEAVDSGNKLAIGLASTILVINTIQLLKITLYKKTKFTNRGNSYAKTIQ